LVLGANIAGLLALILTILQVSVAVSGSVDRQLRVWDLNAGAPLHRIVVGDASPLSFLRLHLLSSGVRVRVRVRGRGSSYPTPPPTPSPARC
jgi:hypothetical protein